MTLHVDLNVAAQPGPSPLVRAIRKVISVAFWSATITGGLLASALVLR